ncbi:MAG: hypothetical protein RL625_601, partial [Gemmatimonadota bacterium]
MALLRPVRGTYRRHLLLAGLLLAAFTPRLTV